MNDLLSLSFKIIRFILVNLKFWWESKKRRFYWNHDNNLDQVQSQYMCVLVCAGVRARVSKRSQL